MKIKQIGTYDGDIISTITENRNIEDIDLFLNPNDNDNLDPFKLKNMQKGIELLLAHVIADSNIGILVDADADGITSASIMYQYLKKQTQDLDITYFMHPTKAHGLTNHIMNEVSDSDIDILIIPDAGSNDFEHIEILKAMNIDVLIIDHHQADRETEHAVLINNQLPDNEETNRNLVGAGMVYKFIEATDMYLNYKCSEEFFDLVAIGQIGDASDISQNEVRNMVFKGLERINNDFVRTVLLDHFGTIEDLAPMNLSFSIIPLINAVVRVGTLEERNIMFNAINGIDADQTFTVTKRKKNKTTGKFDKFEVVQSYSEYALDVCKRVKGRQASTVKKTMAKLDKDVDVSGGIAIGLLETSEYAPITGLIANKISSKYQLPTLLLHLVTDESGNKKYVGSGRGNTKVLPSLKDWCNDTNLVEFASGHPNAFGISIPEENFELFKLKTREVVPEEFVYEVDLHLHGEHDKEAILKVEDNKKLFGGKFHEPLFAFTGIKVDKRFIRQRGSMLTFFDRGLEFIMYGAPEGLFEDLTHNFDSHVIMDFVGRPGKNNWGGKETPQLILSDCEKSESTAPLEENQKEEKEITAETIIF